MQYIDDDVEDQLEHLADAKQAEEEASIQEQRKEKGEDKKGGGNVVGIYQFHILSASWSHRFYTNFSADSNRYEFQDWISISLIQVFMIGNGMGMFQLVASNGADEGLSIYLFLLIVLWGERRSYSEPFLWFSEQLLEGSSRILNKFSTLPLHLVQLISIFTSVWIYSQCPHNF